MVLGFPFSYKIILGLTNKGADVTASIREVSVSNLSQARGSEFFHALLNLFR
jgi:hypothetical protein